GNSPPLGATWGRSQHGRGRTASLLPSGSPLPGSPAATPEASLPPSAGATASALNGGIPTHVGRTPRRRSTGSTGSPPSDHTEPRRKGHKCSCGSLAQTSTALAPTA